MFLQMGYGYDKQTKTHEHGVVFYLVPTYKQQLKCVKPTEKTVTQWSVNAMETLLGCFECTYWGVFKEAATDIHEYTETVCDYVKLNTRKRNMQRKRPPRPARPNTVTSLRRISPPTTLRTFGRV